MKQNEKIVRKGDYYELETLQEALFAHKHAKKEETSSVVMQSSQSIVVEMPSFSQARSNYSFQSTDIYKDKDADELTYELELMLKDKTLKDEDKQEIIKLLKETSQLKEQNILPLNQCICKHQVKSEKISNKDIQIKLIGQYDLHHLESQISQLQTFNYPELSKLEHQIEVLLGEKKISSQSSAVQSIDEKSKEEFQSLYNHLSGLTSLNDLTGLVNKIYLNNDKYVEMGTWSSNIQQISGIHCDFLSELNEDLSLLKKLEESFQSNLENAKIAITKIRAIASQKK